MAELLGDYPSLLNSFIEAGYTTRFFSDPISRSHQLLLRHDIDFDCHLAEKLAEIEHEFGLKATYFFLVSSDSYNLLSSKNASSLGRIRNMGHNIGLHFDPTRHKDTESGLKKEIAIMEDNFDLKIDIISLHRPSETYIGNDQPIAGYDHTYRSEFVKKIAYYSDSGGSFKFGHPLDSCEFHQRKSMQLLTHPIWWTLKGYSAQEVMENHITNNHKALQLHISKNCKSYHPKA